jgi:Na+-transporting NADH:ubiquinone oxidoreductase subunit NqrC
MKPLAQTRARGPMVMILVLGFLAIAILHLLLTIATSQSVYELADLKREKRELDTTSQILSEQVASLASQQNLLNAASKLGMVSNSNPVFLSLEDQTILGKPKPARGSSGQSRNLVANSSMINVVTTNKVVAPASTGEPQLIRESATGPVSVIPASPTR